jgi:hypothetical protein
MNLSCHFKNITKGYTKHYYLAVFWNLIFANCIFAQTDEWCYNHDFYYKNYDDDTLVSIDIENLPSQCILLSNSIFYDNNILKIKTIGIPVSDTLHNILCQQNMINQWYRHLLKHNNEFFQIKSDYVQSRIPEISISYLGQTYLSDNNYSSHIFLIKDGEFYNDTTFNCMINGKILLLNCINTRITSLIIMAWNFYNADGFSRQYYTYRNRKGYYHYKGWADAADMAYARKRDAKKADKINTDLGVVFTFDKDGYVKIIKECEKRF